MNSLDDDTRTRVYNTVNGLTEETIFDLLRNEAFDNLDDMFYIKLRPGQSAQQICQYQYDKYFKPDYSEYWYFIIIDSANATKDGVLPVNLQAEHGYRDAIREMPSMAAMTSGSLCVAQSDWTTRENAFSDYGGQPSITRLGLYDNGANRTRDPFLRIAGLVDSGLHHIIVDTADESGSEPLPITSLNQLTRYTAIELDAEHDINELYEQHHRYTEEINIDPQRFAVVDDEYVSKELLLIQVQPARQFRCRLPGAGELLWWNAIGFMIWDEIESFASKYPA